MKRWIAAFLGVAVVLLGRFREDVGLLLVGWLLFLRRTLPQATVNMAGVATGLVALALLVGVVHYFGRWWRGATPQAADAPPRQWPFRWSLAVLLALFVMFAAGFATIGLARQVGWLFASQPPSYTEAVDYKWGGG